MPIPTPEPGLVISYAYVWDHEAQSGQEEGRKDRPCVIALTVERRQDGETLVTLLPVIGVPMPTTSLNGIDSLLSIVQMPKGVPVATVGVDNAKNAAVLAARILAL